MINKDKIKNICIFGIGGIGGVFGGKIANNIFKTNDSEHKVYFIARGEHLKKIKKDGLILNLPSKKGLVCIPQDAEDSILNIPTPDLCFLCVKGYDLDNALEEISKNVKKDTIIIPLLNGVDIYERIRKKLKDCTVLPSCVYIGAHIEKHGEVSQDSENALIISGRDPMNPNIDLEELKELLIKMEIKYEFKKDSFLDIWEKYLFIASFGLVTAYSGKSFGGVIDDSELRRLTEGVINEILQIAGSKGIKLPDGIGINTINKAKNFPYNTKTSYQRDVENKKLKNERDLFGATILRLGVETGVDTKITENIYNKILNSKD